VSELDRVLALDPTQGRVADGGCHELREGVRHVINPIIERAEQTVIIETATIQPSQAHFSAFCPQAFSRRYGGRRVSDRLVDSRPASACIPNSDLIHAVGKL